MLQLNSFVEKEVATGNVLDTLHWDRIENNVPIAVTEIENPARISLSFQQREFGGRAGPLAMHYCEIVYR